MTLTRFERPHRIRFSECDPAGIVFYPQYFVLFNDLLEAWIDSLLPEVGFAGYIGQLQYGLPTVELHAQFEAVSRMGDQVTLALEVERLGGKSITLQLSCTGADGQLRMKVRQVLVCTSLQTHRSIDIPGLLRNALETGANQQPRSAT
ncbi:acyl-CoA thioesterase [Herbaspirillum rubrisubalbicans]|uniref:Acyl-CoA thioesterase n=1 Tax=Herbaspirillum rubrisubalbicans TaxID=80842 RepID=A0AAD0UCS1_9BURK|nr:thioesterase family protein [Herbaspirillum rubrisubalbicans]ALU91573.1 4-hydroxybenzoyl-COA thioesterase [Herbaspirillum rubrisubalbicans M1]AYR26546.1 acyl-CoA thioesterase [Herbaspirillum rubrisubalbicans]